MALNESDVNWREVVHMARRAAMCQRNFKTTDSDQFAKRQRDAELDWIEMIRSVFDTAEKARES